MESEKLKKNNNDVNESELEKPNLKGDYRNLMILFVLYVLQGV